MHENQKNYFILFFHFISLLFFSFLMKTRYLILKLYLYSIKIQTDIDQNTAENHRFLKRIFLKKFVFYFRAGPNPAHVAGLDPATRAWSLAQASDPNKPCTRKILRVHGTVRR